MKLGVFNLWTEMRELPPSAAFDVSPLFETVADSRAEQAPALLRQVPGGGRPAVHRSTAAKKRKPVVIVDEITAS